MYDGEIVVCLYSNRLYGHLYKNWCEQSLESEITLNAWIWGLPASQGQEDCMYTNIIFKWIFHYHYDLKYLHSRMNMQINVLDSIFSDKMFMKWWLVVVTTFVWLPWQHTTCIQCTSLPNQSCGAFNTCIVNIENQRNFRNSINLNIQSGMLYNHVQS